MNANYEIALNILQKISCTLSSIGSLMIISQVTRSPYNRSKPQQRLILGLSFADFFASIFWIFTPLLISSDSGRIWTTGNLATCNIQGFAMQLFALAGILYQNSLQLQYLLVIRQRWKERQIRKIEKWMHLIPWSFGLSTAIAGAVLKLYNPADWTCWIAPLPVNCTSSHEVNQGYTDLTETDCVRGDNAYIYQWAFFYALLWASILFCLLAMFLNYIYVYQTEARTMQWSVAPVMAMSNEFKKQSMMYASAFLVVWTFPTVTRITQLKKGGEAPDILFVLSGTFVGTQGIWNASIYFRPRFNKCEEDWPVYRKIWSLVHATLFFWTCKGEDTANDNKDYVQNQDNALNPPTVHRTLCPDCDDCVSGDDKKNEKLLENDSMHFTDLDSKL